MMQSLGSFLNWCSPLKTPELALKICVSCRGRRRGRQIIVEEHVRSVPEEWKTTSQLDNLNLSDFRPQYRHVQALKSAPEPVRRIFTLKFASDNEKYEAKYLEYGNKLRKHAYDNDSLEMRITRLTIDIRRMQEEIARMTYEKKRMKLKLQSMLKNRKEFLLELRSRNYEKYCLVMKVLDLKLVFDPEYDMELTPEARSIAEMKLRSFAEVQRIKEEKEHKSREVSELQMQIFEKLKSGEITLTDENQT